MSYSRADEIFLEAMKETRFVSNKEKEFSSQETIRRGEVVGSETLKIDLHGYTVEKAFMKLEEMLAKREKNPKMKLAFVVGKGKHSVSLTPFLRKTFEETLERKGIFYYYDDGVIYL